jgi:glycosyltransferase involved in cell wall biosynthesis
MIGDGEMKKEIAQRIIRSNISDYVKMKDNLPNAELVEVMRDFNILLFTSNRREGWDAVVSEAMGSGCCPIVSSVVGSAPFLIKQGVNGLIYNCKSFESLLNSVRLCLDNRNLMNSMARKAYYTMFDVWSPKNAASNFYSLCNSIKSGSPNVIAEGPCSKAVPFNYNGLGFM